MFSAKMVCLIQKLFGREENSPPNEPNLLSSLEIDCAGAHRHRQSEPVDNFCVQSNCPGRRSAANITPSESRGPSKNTSPQSHHRSRSVSIPACKGITEIGDLTSRIAFAKQDASSAPKLPSACSSSSSLSWSCLEPTLPSSSEDRLLCNRPVSRGAMASAEPVCCCDACMYVLDCTLPFIAHQDTSPYSLPPAYDQVIGDTHPVLPLSGFLPTASSYPSNSSPPSSVQSESSQTSSTAVVR